MNNAFYFLLDTVFNLYLMVVLLRIWLQASRADFYNPLSQFVVKATNPLLIPLRRMIPSIGKLDTGAVVLALVVSAGKMLLIQLLLLGQFDLIGLITGAVLTTLKESFSLLFWVLIIRAILSWFSQGRNPMELVLVQLTEPLLAPVRKIVPPIGGLDLSVLIVLVALQFLQILLQSFFVGLL
jgi:YggT family protein